MGRPCDKNGPGQMGTGYISVGRKNRQKENVATEDPMGRHLQESNRAVVTEQPKTGANGEHPQHS